LQVQLASGRCERCCKAPHATLDISKFCSKHLIDAVDAPSASASSLAHAYGYTLSALRPLP